MSDAEMGSPTKKRRASAFSLSASEISPNATSRDRLQLSGRVTLNDRSFRRHHPDLDRSGREWDGDTPSEARKRGHVREGGNDSVLS